MLVTCDTLPTISIETLSAMSRKPARAEMQETFALLGFAIHILHQIEEHFARATLLGITEKQQRKHSTINDLWSARERMTFGQMVVHFKEDWILETSFEKQLDAFVAERNIVIHRLTGLEGFGIEISSELAALNERITAFIEQEFIMSRFFHGAYLASNEFARHMVKERDGTDIPLETPEEWKPNRDFFLSLVTYRHTPQE
jgi:hypothetical protein